MMKLLILIGVLQLTTSCVSTHIEDRCLLANLQVESLIIEDILNGQSHAKVECTHKE